MALAIDSCILAAGFTRKSVEKHVELHRIARLHRSVMIVSKNPRRKVGGRLDVTFADEIREVAET